MTAHDNSLDAPALQRSLGWTRGLVAQLVAEAGVEDVTQDVWLAALRGRTQTWPPSRSWLASTARKLSAKWWRNAHRGPGVDVAVELDQLEGVAGSAELVERNEEHQRIAQLVLTLEEPLRTTMLLRFQEGLETGVIAEHQSISEDTVRWRIRKGLGQMRSALERERGPDWHAGMAALMGLQPMGPPALEVGASTWLPAATALGGALLSMKLIAFLLAATALAASLWVLDEPDSELRPAAGVTAALEEQSDPSAPSQEQGMVSRSLVEADAQDQERGQGSTSGGGEHVESTCTLVGRVQELDGRALPGVLVAFEYPAGLPSVVTDEAGEFRLVLEQIPKGDAGLEIVPDAYHQVGWVDFAFEGSDQTGSDPLTLQPGIVDLGVIALGPAGAIQGRVLGPDGKRVAAGRVYADHDDAYQSTGELLEPVGDYILGHLLPGPTKVTAELEGFLPAHAELEVVASETLRQDLNLTEGPVISGQVVNQAGQPMAGVTCYKFIIGSRESSTQTDGAGRFSLGFSNQRAVRLKFCKPGWESVDPLLRAVAPGTRDMLVVMAPLPEVTFRVVDANTGTALESYDLEVYLQSGSEGDSNRADWDLSGIDMHSGLTGPHQNFGREHVDAVLVRADGYTGVYRDIQFDEGEPGVMTLALKPISFHSGRVTWQGQPVAGARVELIHQRALYHYEFIEFQGSVSLGPNRDERAALSKLHATGPGGLIGATLHLLDPSEQTFDLGTATPQVVFTDADGAFELQDWSREGPHSLVVTPPVSLSGPGPHWQMSVQLTKQASMDFGTLELPRAKSVSGWVQAPPGGQAAGHELHMPGAMPSSVTTDGQGYFKFHRVAPGARELTLRVEGATGSSRTIEFRLEVREGVDRELNLPSSFPGD